MFNGATFSGFAGFIGATFSGFARFIGATFSGDVGFDHATFSGFAVFDSTTFSGFAGFNDATFLGYAVFDSATFSGFAGFIGATFSGFARFIGATFSGDAGFNGATFSESACFNDAIFSGDSVFDRAVFSGNSLFRNATFSGYAMFNDTIFSGNAGFDNAIFSGTAGFIFVTFSGKAGFDYATFSGEAGFLGAIFKGNTSFHHTTFSRNTGFENSNFLKYVSFDSIQIGSLFSLEQTTFNDSIKLRFKKCGNNLIILMNYIEIKGSIKIELTEIDEGSKFEMDATVIDGKLSFSSLKTEENGDIEITKPKKHSNFDNIAAVMKEKLSVILITVKSTLKIKEEIPDENLIKIKGIMSIDNLKVGKIEGIENLKFENLSSEANVCRNIKRYYEELGRIHNADLYYCREMIAQRKMKHPIVQFFEVPFLEYIFSYGTKPGRLFAFWIVFIGVFTIIYYISDSVDYPVFNTTTPTDYIYFSVTNAMTPGYGGLDPNEGYGRLIASFEAVFGTFFWASFIAIFARKYMRS